MDLVDGLVVTQIRTNFRSPINDLKKALGDQSREGILYRRPNVIVNWTEF